VILQNDFDYTTMEDVAHRPWPVPDSPWLLTQTWHDVLFLHWPVDAQQMRQRLPAGLELDLHDGQAWVAITPFDQTNVGPRAVPAIPWVSSFPQVNVRTYVTVNGKPGVYFFSLDAGNAFIAGAAREMFYLHYFSAQIACEKRDGYVHFRSRRLPSDTVPAELSVKYRGVGQAARPEQGSLEHFFVERYCLYTIDRDFHLYRVNIHHRPWSLKAAEAEIDLNSMADAAGIRLPVVAPLGHFSKRLDSVVWPLQRVD
jgi:uncharacterized protein YqjF (DUF2071 family)